MCALARWPPRKASRELPRPSLHKITSGLYVSVIGGTADPAADAWSDYWGCILELEIHRFARDGAEATQYGRRWVSVFLRGVERMSVAIERTA